MSNKTIQISTSTTTATPPTLKFGELALSSIDGADKLYIGNSSQVPKEIQLSTASSSSTVNWIITSNAASNLFINGPSALFVNFYAQFFNVEYCSKTGLAPLFNATTGRFTVPYDGVYVIVLGAFFNGIQDGTRWQIQFNTAEPTTNNYFINVPPSSGFNGSPVIGSFTKYLKANDYFVFVQNNGQTTTFMLGGHTYCMVSYMG
jgi:hypothetical protein